MKNRNTELLKLYILSMGLYIISILLTIYIDDYNVLTSIISIEKNCLDYINDKLFEQLYELINLKIKISSPHPNCSLD